MEVIIRTDVTAAKSSEDRQAERDNERCAPDKPRFVKHWLKNPPAAREKAAEQGEKKNRPHRNHDAPETIFADECEEKKNGKHCQRVSRHAFDESDANQQQPVAADPGRINRPEFKPTPDRAGKAQSGKN